MRALTVDCDYYTIYYHKGSHVVGVYNVKHYSYCSTEDPDAFDIGMAQKFGRITGTDLFHTQLVLPSGPSSFIGGYGTGYSLLGVSAIRWI